MSKHRVWAASAAVAALAFASAAQAQANDPLVQVLVQKGVISAQDAAGVTTRDQLVKLLVAKGVISPTDATNIAQAEPTMLSNAEVPPNRAPVYFHTDHPTEFSIGNVDLTVGGFLDAEMIARSTNTGNVASTNFGSIPFTNQIQGHSGEDRITGQMSRVSLRADTDFMIAGRPAHAYGYVEGDFNGNDAANVFVESNSHGARLRLAYLDVTTGQWEFLAGQAWTLLTPNRTGATPDPSSLFLTQNYDSNYSVGMPWGRIGQARVTYHPTANLAIALAVQDADPYIGAGEVTFPAGQNAQLGIQFDAANQSTTGNLFPDIVAKVAYDGSAEQMPFHLEATGIVSQFRSVTLPTAGAVGFGTHMTTGWGAGINGNFKVTPQFTLFADTFYGQGEGRYLGGLGPDVVTPVAPFGAGFDSSLSTVSGYGLLGGAEFQVSPRALLAAYYGFDHFDRNTFVDLSSLAATKPFIGFGGLNSSNADNKDLSELSVDGNFKFWSSPTDGTLVAGFQYSYVMRHQWFVPLGAPSEANTNMFFVDLRYILP
ncbi:MAG TPA: hypothetical protein VKU90_09870 [Caulobacteraceae bacterium]|nr:hypothetical protein [Caulobacteraceae bacterium]